MLKRFTAVAAAATAIALAAPPAQAEAQVPSDVLTGVTQNLPHTPALPAPLSPDIHPPLLGNLTVPISPYIPTIP